MQYLWCAVGCEVHLSPHGHGGTCGMVAVKDGKFASCIKIGLVFWPKSNSLEKRIPLGGSVCVPEQGPIGKHNSFVRVFAEPLCDALNLVGVPDIVLVGEEYDFAATAVYGLLEIGADSEIFLVMINEDVCIVLRPETLDYLQGLVRAPIVAYHNFIDRDALAKDGFELLLNELLPVICAKCDRKSHVVQPRLVFKDDCQSFNLKY